MDKQPIQRRLAAIVAEDVVGYSRLMERDETATLAALKERRKSVLEPLVARHKGRIFKLTGDGVLAEFGSAVNAVQCAVELQREMTSANSGLAEERCIVLRIGINLGDIMVEGRDLYGDGVNIAARLEGLAEPGGILVSGTAYDYVRNKVSAGFDDLGAQRLKNIAEPVSAYRVTGRPVASAARAIAEKPSVAVLPFTNMSSDPEQDYFADGLAEDLITDLSKVPGLMVIARHSTFAYKGKAIDIRSVARDLGVRYVVEGSVRRASARVRITVQLIEASDASHLWADRFDRDLADIFMLQDEVVSRIVNALAGVLPAPHPVTRRRTSNLEAYDLFVRGRVQVAHSRESNKAALVLLEKSIEIDPDFAEAHAWLAMGHYFAWGHGGEAEEKHRPLARSAARQAVTLDHDDAVAHAILGYVLIFDARLEEAAREIAMALRINPNHANAWAPSVDLKVLEGRPVEGIECAQNAFRLNPHPPGWYYWFLGYAQYAAGNYGDAIITLSHESTLRTASQRILAASLAQLGRMNEAIEEARSFVALNPRFSVRRWADSFPFLHEEDRQHFVDGYLKAGLPA